MERFAEPDPKEYFSDGLEKYKHALLTYTILVGVPTLLQILLFLLLLTSSALHQQPLVFISVRFFLLFLVIGFLFVIYQFISILLSIYRFASSHMNLRPIPEENDTRLQIQQSGFKEEYGVQLSNARSLTIGVGCAFIASIWMNLIDFLISKFANSNILQLNQLLQKNDTQEATEIFVTIASVATRTDVQNLIGLLDLSDYYMVIKFVPPIVIGYISFIHIAFLIKKLVRNENEGNVAENELRGLLEYLRYSFAELRNRRVGTELWEIVKLSIVSWLLTVWQLWLLWSLFF